MSRSDLASPGGSTALLGQVDRPVGVRERARLLTRRRRGQDDVGELGRLGQEQVLDDDEQLRLAQDAADAPKLGQRGSRVRRGDPQELDRSLLGVAEDLHRVRRRRPVRDRVRLDVPQLRELADVRLVVPVAKPGQVSVGAGLARVLRRRLPVHLKHAGARTAEHAAQQMQVVDLARGRRRLVGLVEALEHRRQQPLTGADELGRRFERGGRHATDVSHSARRPRLDRRLELVEAERVLRHVLLVGPAAVRGPRAGCRS